MYRTLALYSRDTSLTLILPPRARSRAINSSTVTMGAVFGRMPYAGAGAGAGAGACAAAAGADAVAAPAVDDVVVADEAAPAAPVCSCRARF